MGSPLPFPPLLIDTPAALAQMLERLQPCPIIALDSESNSLFAYRERVCLIQISAPDADYVVDTLALTDISALGRLFADGEKEKVFHGADYDVGTLRRDYGFEFCNIFDTMIASRFLGIKQFGLSSLLEQRFGLHLDKRMQRHDWGRRPLRIDELKYAGLDAHYLLPLRDQLLSELRGRGREREARQAFERVAGAMWCRRPFEAEDFWRIKGATALDDVGRGVLKHLAIWREQRACELDRPPFKVLSDATLVEIARHRPTSWRSLDDMRGLPKAHLRSVGPAILEAVKAGQRDPQTPAMRPAHDGRPDEATLERYERLRSWRKERAAGRQVEPDVLVSNSLLMEIARRAPADLEALGCIEGLNDYQRETYGVELVTVVQRDS